jgi:NuA3 HAT complex component NTO1
VEGFNRLQSRLDEKLYTSVQTFNEDLVAVLSAKIDFIPVASVEDAEQEMNKVAHSTLTVDQKETKKLVKRIIKGVQPHFEEAMRKEADLAGRPYEKFLDLETLLEQNLQRRSSLLSADENAQPITEGNLTGEDPRVNGDELHEGLKKSDEVQFAPTPDENVADQHAVHDEAADEAAIAAQLGQDAMRASNEKPQGDAIDTDHRSSNDRAEPLTPPRSEKNLLNPLVNGGIPWYLETFDIHGTTVHEERYTGREVLRAMSEELSELDDDELDGLAGSDPVCPSDAPDATMADLQNTVARKRQRRTRAYG